MMEMEQSNLTNVSTKTKATQYIIPLLFDDSAYFSEKYNFINAYIKDYEKPYLYHHVFILFKYDVKLIGELDKYFEKNKYFYKRDLITINSVCYIEYIFINNNKAIDTVICGYYWKLHVEDKIKIIKFWGVTDCSYLQPLFYENYGVIQNLEEQNECIFEKDPPEEDLNKKLLHTFIDFDDNEEGYGLSVPYFYSSPYFSRKSFVDLSS